MEILLLNEEQKEKFADAILGMLKASDSEFVPPLSRRASTTQKSLSGAKTAGDGVSGYFSSLIKQKILASVEGETLLGFMSFIENFENDVVKKLPNVYVSTIIVSPAARGKSLTKKMYKALAEEFPERSIFTRTWSENAAHIRILDALGFSEYHRIKNDRGENIDTVYFEMEVLKGEFGCRG